MQVLLETVRRLVAHGGAPLSRAEALELLGTDHVETTWPKRVPVLARTAQCWFDQRGVIGRTIQWASGDLHGLLN